MHIEKVNVLSEKTERTRLRQIRAFWYKKKVSSVIFPSFHNAMAKPMNVSRVLSVGTGGGEDVEVFTSMGIDSVGIDADKENAPLWSNKRLQCILADGCNLPFRDGVFDCITTIEVIEHIGQEKPKSLKRIEREKFTKDILRVRAKNGAIFLSTPNKKFPIDIAHAGMDKKIAGGLRLGGMRVHLPWESFTVSVGEIKEMFEKERNVSVFLVSPLGYINWDWEIFTKHSLIRIILFPISKLFVRLLDKSNFIRASPLNPHIIILIR
jgi:2-polyprenyl-3-methyl-5-hydroxy-6-metoxy-1,4-benzoquinol methylase